MSAAVVTEYRGYKIVHDYDRNRPLKWMYAVAHPTEAGRHMSRKTVAGCKQLIDAIRDKLIRF